MNQGWTKLSIDISSDQVELWSEHLSSEGALYVDIGDALDGKPNEVPLFKEPGEESVQFWDRCCLSALFEPNTEQNWIHWIEHQSQQLGVPTPHCTCATVDDQDWVTLTQAQFQPIQISSRLWVLPSWHDPISTESINLIVDPGMAFGTGTHPTTRLCLEWLDANIQADQTVLDYGCGSGILGIAAAKLGAQSVIGVDIDPVALEVAQRNASINHAHIETLLPKQLDPARKFNCVVANILANPLRALAPLLCQHVEKEKGTLLLSGLWQEQAEDIASYYSTQGYNLKVHSQYEGWVLLVGHHTLTHH
jgi:ribosomal protein L11 methyltransferase